MKYIIFIILVLIILFLVISYERKLTVSRRQLLVANSQINSLRKKVPRESRGNNFKNLNIKFTAPASSMGIINENSNIYISPLTSSYLLRSTDIKMEVKILDKALVNNETWFYISLPIDTNINSRGWTNQKSFSYFYGNSTDITYNK